MFVATCPGCYKRIGVPRPGSHPKISPSDLQQECPFCGTAVFSSTGVDVEPPPEPVKEFDLLSVD